MTGGFALHFALRFALHFGLHFALRFALPICSGAASAGVEWRSGGRASLTSIPARGSTA
jgi:hypothetical protein